MPTRVFLIDDSSDTITQLSGMLHRDTARFEVVGSATSGHQGLDQLRRTPTDIVLLDLSMPRMNGIEVLERIRAQWPVLPVLILTAYHDAAWVEPALSRGASGYVLKTSSADEITAAIEAAVVGSFPTTREVMEELASTVPVGAATSGNQTHLSASERRLLDDVAQGLTNAEIATMRHVSVGTVKQVLAAVSRKLEARNRTHLVTQAARKGLISFKSHPTR